MSEISRDRREQTADRYGYRLRELEAGMRASPDDLELRAEYGAVLYREGFRSSALAVLQGLVHRSLRPDIIDRIIPVYEAENLPFSLMNILKAAQDRGEAEPKHLDLLYDLRKRFPSRTVTFYIPCYNQEKHIEGCIRGILAQSYPVREILVVDDGSTDGSVGIAKRYPVRILHHGGNRGLSAARNTACREASGEFLASVDTDAVLDHTWLERIMLDFTDDSIAGICGKLIEANTVTVVDRWRQVHMRQHWGDTRVENPDFLFGAGNVLRTNLLRRVGGYDERFRTNGEDCYISMKFREAGYTILYEPRAEARHLRVDTVYSVVNTHWKYLTPYYEINGTYSCFETIVPKINFDLVKVTSWLTEDLNMGQFHIYYPTFLSYFAFILYDICKMFDLALINKEAIMDTLIPVFASLRNVVNGLDIQDIDFKNGVLADLREGIGRAVGKSEMHRFSDEELERIFPSDLYPLDDAKARRLAVGWRIRFPKGDLNFAHDVLDKISRVIGKLGPAVLKAVAASRERIRCESESADRQYPGRIKAVLANPPAPGGGCDPDSLQSPRVPSFSSFPAHVTGRLREKGFNAILVDAAAERLSEEEFLERLKGFHSDLVMIDCSTAGVESCVHYARLLRIALPACHINLSGIHAGVSGRPILEANPAIDSVFPGEYGEAACLLAERAGSGGDPSEVVGLYFQPPVRR